MNIELFGNQVKLLNSRAEITEWSDGFGAGKTFAALAKAASTQGVVLYVTPQANWQFKHLPDFISDNFKLSFVSLSAMNDTTQIFFVSPDHFDDNFIGRRPNLVVFDGCEPSNAEFEKILVKGSNTVFIGNGEHHFYRETHIAGHKNPYLA